MCWWFAYFACKGLINNLNENYCLRKTPAPIAIPQFRHSLGTPLPSLLQPFCRGEVRAPLAT